MASDNDAATDAGAASGDSGRKFAATSGSGRSRIGALGHGGLRWLNYLASDALPLVAGLLVVAAIVAIYFFREVVVLIPPGHAGAIYRPFQGGTETDYVYPEGVHFIPPWDEMYVYDMRVQTVLHDLLVLTNKGLPIELKLAIRYYPEYELLGLLHKDVGPDYVHKIVIPQIESVLRRQIGRRDPEEIYTNKEGILTDIVLRAIDEAGKKYVFIDDIIIRTVQLPPQIEEAINDKLVHQQQWEAYEFRLLAETKEAERKRIEAQGIRDYQSTVNETLNENLITWHGIDATRDLAESDNTKIVIFGSSETGLPLILGQQ